MCNLVVYLKVILLGKVKIKTFLSVLPNENSDWLLLYGNQLEGYFFQLFAADEDENVFFWSY